MINNKYHNYPSFSLLPIQQLRLGQCMACATTTIHLALRVGHIESLLYVNHLSDVYVCYTKMTTCTIDSDTN